MISVNDDDLAKLITENKRLNAKVTELQGHCTEQLMKIRALSEEIGVRPVVAWFAKHMERKLRANEHKGGWLEDDHWDLFKAASDELSELNEAMSRPDDEKIIEEAADVANMVMMVADVHGQKYGDSQ